MAQLKTPYGGALNDGLVPPERREALQRQSRGWPSWDMTLRQLCDFELLLNGAFSPLRGFMGREDHEAVCGDMRLQGGQENKGQAQGKTQRQEEITFLPPSET